jgi:type I restriction enzyme S subunit
MSEPRNEYAEFLRAIPDRWSRVKMREVGRIVSGGTPSRDAPSLWGGGIPWVTPGELTALPTKEIEKTAETISAAGLAGSGANLLPVNSLLITSRATLGARAVNAVPMATNQGFKSVVPFDRRFTDYLYHLTEKIKPEMVRRASGTTFLEISGSEFGDIVLPLPQADEAIRIAEILDTLDAAIRGTEAVVAKLRAMKQGLLHDLLTRGIDANGDLRPPQPEAPHLYQQTPLGWLPKEWEVRLLDEVAQRGSGHTPSKSIASYWNGGIKWVSLADSHRLDQVFIHETDKEISEAGLANSSAVRHPPDTVILSRDAGIGKSAILASEMAVSQHFMAWRCGFKLNHVFLYYVLQNEKPKFEAIAMGSTIKTIGLSFFKKYQIALPPKPEQDHAAEILLETEGDIARHDDELGKLKSLKSGLMDDLLTGRVSVSSLLPTEGRAHGA